MECLIRAEEMRALEREYMERTETPSLALMERAAHALAHEVQRFAARRKRRNSALGVIGPSLQDGPDLTQALETLLRERQEDSKAWIGVFCGPGNNGGDGLAAARLLREKGLHVRVFLVGDEEKMTPNAREMARRLAAQGGAVEAYEPEDILALLWRSSCDAWVDCLFGVGLSRDLTGAFRQAVEEMNRGQVPVIACDIPSGIETDTGRVLGCAVRAERTVTFEYAKLGHFLGRGPEYAGEVLVAPLGIRDDRDPRLDEAMPRTMDCREVWLPRRRRDGHKGDFGRVYILAGAEGYTGAAVLCTQGAVRTGAGLVTLGVPREIYPLVAPRCGSAMPYPLPRSQEEILARCRGCDVAVLGPGLGRTEETQGLVRRLLEELEIPVVLDADGINALGGHINVLANRRFPTVLTPHEGELARLTGEETPIRDRVQRAAEFAGRYGCVLVLKGAGTVVAGPEGQLWVNTTGNPGMAKGGSGDVLAGMIGALMAQGCPPLLSARYGVCLHGKAGDLAAEELGEYAMAPEDLLNCLPRALKAAEERGRAFYGGLADWQV